jgi:hypothetical protein
VPDDTRWNDRTVRAGWREVEMTFDTPFNVLLLKPR